MLKTLWDNTRNQRIVDDICYNRNQFVQAVKKGGGGGGGVKITGFLWHLKNYLLNVFWTDGMESFKRNTRKSDRVCTTGRWVQTTPDRLYLFGKKTQKNSNLSESSTGEILHRSTVFIDVPIIWLLRRNRPLEESALTIFLTQELFLCVSDQSIYNIASVSVNLTVNFKTGLMPLSLGTSTLLLGLLYFLGHPRRGHTVCHPPRDKRRMFVQTFTETRIVSTDCVSGTRDSWKRWQNIGLKVLSTQSSHISRSHYHTHCILHPPLDSLLQKTNEQNSPPKNNVWQNDVFCPFLTKPKVPGCQASEQLQPVTASQIIFRAKSPMSGRHVCLTS